MFAADDATPVRFEVEAPCTDAPRFAASVAERTPRIIPAPPATTDADTVEVRVEGTRGSFRIVSAKDGGASAPRTLEGASCEEVVAALGLAVALVFDPDASDKPKPTPFTRFGLAHGLLHRRIGNARGSRNGGDDDGGRRFSLARDLHDRAFARLLHGYGRVCFAHERVEIDEPTVFLASMTRVHS